MAHRAGMRFIVWLFRDGIGGFFAKLWGIANFWRIPMVDGVRIGSPLAGATMFMFMLFCVIGLGLVIVGSVFGFGLGDVDAWLAAQGPWMDLVGKVLIQKVLMALLLVFSVILFLVVGWAATFGRASGEGLGWGATILILLACLMVGYCSSVNMVAPLDPYDPSITAIE